MRDPYDILGVSRTASEPDIKKAFRKLAKEYHPDRNANDPKAKDKFAEVNSAYEIVGDATKRAQFDRGEIDAEGKPRFQGFEGFGGGPGGGRSSGFEGFEFNFGQGGPGRGQRAGAGPGGDDFFSQLFGEAMRSAGRGGGRPRAPAKGDDVQAAITVTIEEIARETRKRIVLPTGREVEVAMPKGVTDGQVVRLRGLGLAGSGGADAGDALLTVHIMPDDRFTIENGNLRSRLPVELEDAILGGTVRVPTPTGAVDMTIPPMTNSGRVFRLRNKGLPIKGGTGDLLVSVEIRLPESADEALTAYAQSRRAARAV